MIRLMSFASLPVLVLLLLSGCSEQLGPAAGTPLPENGGASLPSGFSLAPISGNSLFGSPFSQNADEEFNCTNIGDVHVRFGTPGFVRDNAVGLFVSFEGVPDVPMTLRVWWSFEDDPGSYQDVPLLDEDVRRNEDGVIIDTIVEHTYQGLNGPTNKRVRVELILDDSTGNCARVRDVTVAPASGSGSGSVYQFVGNLNGPVNISAGPEQSFGLGNGTSAGWTEDGSPSVAPPPGTDPVIVCPNGLGLAFGSQAISVSSRGRAVDGNGFSYFRLGQGSTIGGQSAAGCRAYTN
jgi:hypothetical protein